MSLYQEFCLNDIYNMLEFSASFIGLAGYDVSPRWTPHMTPTTFARTRELGFRLIYSSHVCFSLS